MNTVRRIARHADEALLCLFCAECCIDQRMTATCSRELCGVHPTPVSLSCYFDVDKVFRCLSGPYAVVKVRGARGEGGADLHIGFQPPLPI